MQQKVGYVLYTLPTVGLVMTKELLANIIAA